MSLTSIGGRRTGSFNSNILAPTIDSIVDNSIYFGGPENVTNAFNRIAHSGAKVRVGSFPVSILISASSEINDEKEIAPQLEFLKGINRRMLVVSINVDKNSTFTKILSRYSIEWIDVRHWDSLYMHAYKVIDFLNTIS